MKGFSGPLKSIKLHQMVDRKATNHGLNMGVSADSLSALTFELDIRSVSRLCDEKMLPDY